LLVLGEPGAGKTMTLYRLFFEAAESILSYSAKSPLPYYVSLPDLTPGLDLLDYLGEGLDRELFRSDLEEGRFLFLVDGTDGLDNSVAARALGSLNVFMRNFPLNRFVVAAREPSLIPLNIPARAELLPLGEFEALDFVMDGGAPDPAGARSLVEALAGGMGRLARNPQVLAMARRLWKEGLAVPRSRTRLFADFYRVAAGSLAREIRDELLPGLAHLMSRRARTSLPARELEDDAGTEAPSVKRALMMMRAPGETDAECLNSILVKARLVRGPHAFAFPNLALQEFLTAVALERIGEEALVSLIARAEWVVLPAVDERPHNLNRGPYHGTMVFVSGLLDDSSLLVEGLVRRDLVLATACARESQRLSPGAFDRLSSEIDAYLEGDALRQRVGMVALEVLGDPVALKRLEQAAADPAHPARAVALAALGRMASNTSLSVLEAASIDADPAVAATAREALARLKVS
jgi:hypothetical protein